MELSEDGFSPPEDINMKRKTITNICTIPAALFLVLIGIVHSMVNFSGLRRALARGQVAARLGGWGGFDAALSGLFLPFLPLLVRLFPSGLPARHRPGWP